MSSTSQVEDKFCEFSIIVPTYNEERNLPRLLRSLFMQRAAQFEVIVVDQESGDATTAVARASGCTILTRQRSRFYSPPATSRNIGAAASHGKYLLHLDADMELPHADFLTSLRAQFSEDIQAIVIHERDVATGFWSKVKAAERLCYDGSSIESARAVTKTLFNEIGGYNTKISSGEDYDISRRYAMHSSIGIDHHLTLKHYTGRISLRDLLIKKFKYGRSVNEYLAESRAAGGPTALALVRTHVICFLRRWDLLLKDPLHYCGIFVLRGLEFLAIVFGMICGKLAPTSTAPIHTPTA